MIAASASSPLGRAFFAGAEPLSVHAPVVPLYRQVGDWLVVCDNARGCEIKALPDDMSDAATAMIGFSMSVLREAGPIGALAVSLQGGDENGNDAGTTPASVELDGKVLRPLAWKIDADKHARLGRDAALGLIRRIRDGRALTLSFASGSSRISLRGFRTALRLCDEVQGRVHTTTALDREGPAPSSSVPVPPPLPVLKGPPPSPPVSDRAALLAMLRKTQRPVLSRLQCDPSATDEDDVEPLDAHEALVLLTCDDAAYQSAVVAFRVPRERPAGATRLELPLPAGVPLEGGPSETFLTEGSYDSETGELQSFDKGRGLADCGEYAVWRFDGRDFHLSSYALQQSCGGEAGDWPIMFRSRSR